MDSFDYAYLASLQENWDSYGAPPLDKNCIEKARELYATLPDNGWWVVPCSDGGVQIEKHEGGLDIELTISPCGNCRAPIGGSER